MRTRILLLAAALSLALRVPAPAEGLGEDVRLRLTELGYLGSDASESAAVLNFQRVNGLLTTGIADGDTVGAIMGESAVGKADYLSSFAGKYADTEMDAGQYGEQVGALQRTLISLGFLTGTADGAYGDATAAAVSRFQLANGLPRTGRADAAALKRMYEGDPVSWEAFLKAQCCARGDTGADVKRLQNLLYDMGYFTGAATGSYGELTQQAVRQFQTENGLEVNGEAGIGVCALAYSGEAKALFAPDEMRLGDVSEDVRLLQRSLTGLGYYARACDGRMDEGLLTAAMLFQIANHLPVDGGVSAATLALVQTEGAVSMANAAEDFAKTREKLSDDAAASLAALAEDELGRAFATDGDALFPGFCFVQHICARAGVALTEPGQAVGVAYNESAQNLRPGDIVILQVDREDGVALLMTVCLGGGRVAYASDETGHAVVGNLSQMTYDGLYVCSFAAQGANGNQAG